MEKLRMEGHGQYVFRFMGRDLYKDKVIIGNDLFLALAVEMKPTDDKRFQLQATDDQYLVPWDVTGEDVLRKQIR